MLKSVKIPSKLALSFLTICTSAAVMMAVFFVNLTMIETSTVGNNLGQSILAKTLTLETALLRQNSQMRGFLVTSDASYLKSYGEARDEYDRTSVELEKQLTGPAQQAAVQASRTATLAWREAWGDRLIARVKAGSARPRRPKGSVAKTAGPPIWALGWKRSGHERLQVASFSGRGNPVGGSLVLQVRDQLSQP